MNENLTLVISIIAAILGAGGIGAVITAFVSRHKVKADAHKTSAETVTEQIGSLTQIINQLKEHNDRLNQQNIDVSELNKQTQRDIEEIRDLIRECFNFDECPVKHKNLHKTGGRDE